ncbi:MAG: FxLYD domain-containing protein [Chloroflexi bacterium]|nr:FxLYD domain-containing protein [Chloroflexota bacterium]
MIKNAVIAALAVVLALSIAGVVAQTQRTATVQVRIYEDIEDPTVHYISSRPHGGEWTESREVPPLNDGFVQAGKYRFVNVWVGATIPQPIPPAVELFDLECTDQAGPDGSHRILRGSLRNLANATLTEVTITAALVNEDGVEVLQVTDGITGAIAHGGERPFTVSFTGAPNVAGTCPVVSIDYTATVRYEVPIP